jgi:hypothetical protein
MKLNVALCALLAVLPFASAQAAEEKSPFEVELGGYIKMYGNYTSQDTAPGTDVRNTDILRRTEVHFNAEHKLESGTKVGVHVETLADAGADFAIDESLIYFSGDWGNINFGAKDGAAFLLQVAAPSADKDIDGVRQQIQPVNITATGLAIGETDYDQNISAKSDKITYITPLYEGFQAGVSYTPEVDSSRGANGNSLSNDDTTANSQVFDGAVRFQKKFKDFKLTTGAGYTQAQRETGPGDNVRHAWNAALVLGYKGLDVGAAYQLDDEASSDGNDVTYTVFGIGYKTGKMNYGASYYIKDDNVGTAIDTRRATFGVSYDYAPGMSLRSSFSHFTSEADTGVSRDANSFLMGMQINF